VAVGGSETFAQPVAAGLNFAAAAADRPSPSRRLSDRDGPSMGSERPASTSGGRGVRVTGAWRGPMFAQDPTTCASLHRTDGGGRRLSEHVHTPTAWRRRTPSDHPQYGRVARISLRRCVLGCGRRSPTPGRCSTHPRRLVASYHHGIAELVVYRTTGHRQRARALASSGRRLASLTRDHQTPWSRSPAPRACTVKRDALGRPQQAHLVVDHYLFKSGAEAASTGAKAERDGPAKVERQQKRLAPVTDWGQPD